MNSNTSDGSVAVGVIGAGSMGQNHVRVYDEVSGANLVGITDVDTERANKIAAEFGTTALSQELLLEQADAVSIAVPTQFHHDVAAECFDSGVHTLIEKPIAPTAETAEEICQLASAAGVKLQIGHIERFNPAVQTLLDIVPELDVIAVSAERLGPPIEREIDDTVVLDLMIHDIDVVRSLLDEEPEDIDTTGVESGRYATATIEFDGGTIGRLTASRVTQQKTRQLVVTAQDCVVEIDYIDQSVEIHYDSAPEYVERDGDVRYRHESVVERPVVENGEPLRAEIEAFLDAIRRNKEPVVTGEDGTDALRIARQIDEAAFGLQDS